MGVCTFFLFSLSSRLPFENVTFRRAPKSRRFPTESLARVLRQSKITTLPRNLSSEFVSCRLDKVMQVQFHPLFGGDISTRRGPQWERAENPENSPNPPARGRVSRCVTLAEDKTKKSASRPATSAAALN